MKKLLLRIFFVAAGTLITVLYLEGVVRFLGWPAPGFHVGRSGPIPIAATGNAPPFPPNVRGRFVHYDYNTEWRVNGDGFRERELQAKRSGEWRVGVIG